MIKNAKVIVAKDGKLIVGILTYDAVMEKKPKPIFASVCIFDAMFLRLHLFKNILICNNIKQVTKTLPEKGL